MAGFAFVTNPTHNAMRTYAYLKQSVHFNSSTEEVEIKRKFCFSNFEQMLFCVRGLVYGLFFPSRPSCPSLITPLIFTDTIILRPFKGHYQLFKIKMT